MFTQKALCLGVNTFDTDHKVSRLAKENSTTNHGLITDPNFVASLPGYYHTTVIDLTLSEITTLAQQFDTVILLDQPRERWGHWKPLLSTFKLMMELEKGGVSTVYRDNKNISNLLYWHELLSTNPSFCIYPWVLLQNDFGYVSLCTRSEEKVVNAEDIKDWQTNPEYANIRNDMLNGIKLPVHCRSCYNYENMGIQSSRIFETLEWVAKLNLGNVDELKNISSPYYYEVRLDNTCNLGCRSCKPEHSTVLNHEYKKLNLVYEGKQTFQHSGFEHVTIDDLNTDRRVYVCGGEPTVIPEFYNFLQRCIDQKRTDFDLAIGTNGYKFDKKLFELTDKFSNCNFSFSIDGYKEVNDYLRWPSKFDDIIKNAHRVLEHGHTLSFLCVPSIYNLPTLHLLLEFLDQEFPNSGLYLQVNRYPMQTPYNYPVPDTALDSIVKCMKTNHYRTDGRAVKTTIDSLYNHYSNSPSCDLELLRKFFTVNDRMDQNRNMWLKDYMPELDACKKLL